MSKLLPKVMHIYAPSLIPRLCAPLHTTYTSMQSLPHCGCVILGGYIFPFFNDTLLCVANF